MDLVQFLMKTEWEGTAEWIRFPKGVTPSFMHQWSCWVQLGFLSQKAETQVSARLGSQLEASGESLLPDVGCWKNPVSWKHRTKVPVYLLGSPTFLPPSSKPAMALVPFYILFSLASAPALAFKGSCEEFLGGSVG